MSVGSGRTEERLLSFESVCREHGLSITPQRVAIYKELISSSEHPSAITIFNKVREYYPNISLDTVNRTLLYTATLFVAHDFWERTTLKRRGGLYARPRRSSDSSFRAGINPAPTQKAGSFGSPADIFGAMYNFSEDRPGQGCRKLWRPKAFRS